MNSPPAVHPLFIGCQTLHFFPGRMIMIRHIQSIRRTDWSCTSSNVSDTDPSCPVSWCVWCLLFKGIVTDSLWSLTICNPWNRCWFCTESSTWVASCIIAHLPSQEDNWEFLILDFLTSSEQRRSGQGKTRVIKSRGNLKDQFTVYIYCISVVSCLKRIEVKRISWNGKKWKGRVPGTARAEHAELLISPTLIVLEVWSTLISAFVVPRSGLKKREKKKKEKKAPLSPSTHTQNRERKREKQRKTDRQRQRVS